VRVWKNKSERESRARRVGTLVCVHVANAVANCIKLLLNWFEVQRWARLCFERARIGETDFLCACVRVQLSKNYYVSPATIVNADTTRFIVPVKGIHPRDKLRTIFAREWTYGLIQDILLRKCIESLLWSPKKNTRHLSEPSIDHFRNTIHTDESITDLIEITWSIPIYCM